MKQLGDSEFKTAHRLSIIYIFLVPESSVICQPGIPQGQPGSDPEILKDTGWEENFYYEASSVKRVFTAKLNSHVYPWWETGNKEVGVFPLVCFFARRYDLGFAARCCCTFQIRVDSEKQTVLKVAKPGC